jgi:Cytidylate kinase-like family
VTVWAIDAEPGAGGHEIGRLLAERADVPLVDGLDAPAGGWLVRYGLVLGLATRPAPELAHELERLARLPNRAARAPCVIVDGAACAALAEDPRALRVSVVAPRAWRARRIAVEHCIPLARARRELVQADWRRRVRRRRKAGRFDIRCDASKLARDAIVEALLLLGGS